MARAVIGLFTALVLVGETPGGRPRPLDDKTLDALLGALTIVSDALDAAPHDLPPPPPRQTARHLQRS